MFKLSTVLLFGVAKLYVEAKKRSQPADQKVGSTQVVKLDILQYDSGSLGGRAFVASFELPSNAVALAGCLFARAAS